MSGFLREHRLELIERCQVKVASRTLRPATAAQLRFGIPLFLTHLEDTLDIEQTDRPLESRRISGPSGGGAELFDIGVSAAQHGRQLAELGFTVDQVVHDYGDLCQSISDLAFEGNIVFTIDEFRTLNRCLDNAVAQAVTEFTFQKDAAALAQREREEEKRLGIFAHELRNHLSTLSLAFTAAKLGGLSLTGATGNVLERSIHSLKNLIDQSLINAQGLPSASLVLQTFSVADFIEELQSAAELSAASQGCTLIVTPVEPHLAVEADRELLLAALGNLLLNGFKFTRSHTAVTLNAYASADQILFDVKDHCGGLPTGAAEEMFLPFRQIGSNRTGLGLGLSIARTSVELFGGAIHVRDVPDEGCIFTLSLPRHKPKAETHVKPVGN